MTKDEALTMALDFIERVNKDGWLLADFEPEMYAAITAIKEALAQSEQEPVAMLERDSSIGRLRVTYEDAVTELDEGVYPLYTKPQGWRNNVAQAYLKGFDEASTPSFKVKERLIRIMGTFDLATGHANTFDELLDALESELRDVLGHYREALAQPEQEPVAWMVTYGGLTHIAYTQPNMVVDTHYQPLYAAPQPLTPKIFIVRLSKP